MPPIRQLELTHLPANVLRSRFGSGRVHPSKQRDAVAAMMEEVGFVQPILARPTSKGDIEILDGDLRASLCRDGSVPVLIVEASDADARKIRLTLDVASGMALLDKPQQHALLCQLEPQTQAFRALVVDLKKKAKPRASKAVRCAASETRRHVLIDCVDEQEQREIYEQLQTLRVKCRVLVI